MEVLNIEQRYALRFHFGDLEGVCDGVSVWIRVLALKGMPGICGFISGDLEGHDQYFSKL